MTYRTLLTAIAVFGLVFSGCGKKPKQAQNQNVQIPTVATTPAADTAVKKDSVDVFNEFYKDSKEQGAKSKKISKTFSVNTENQTPESYTPEFSESGRYVVQIAASSSQAAADELTASIKGKGYPAYVTEVQNPTPVLQGTYYRVRIGGFATMADAKSFGENILRPANYDYWVDLKSNEGMSSGNYTAPSSTTPYPSTEATYTPPAYTPSTSTEPAAATPAYTPTEQNWSSSTPAASPSTTTSTGTEATTGSTWSTGSSTPPATEPPSTPPSSSGGTGTWGETGWKADSSSK
jgi:hypothetical protein